MLRLRDSTLFLCGPYKPRTGQCNAPTILAVAAPSLIYSTHRVLVVWIVIAHLHLFSSPGTLSHYTILEVSAVQRPTRVCCGRWCVLFINILDSLTAPCLVHNTTMYTVYGRCSEYGPCMVHTLAGAACVWFIWTLFMATFVTSSL